jgi:hypothetical protein
MVYSATAAAMIVLAFIRFAVDVQFAAYSDVIEDKYAFLFILIQIEPN